MTTSINWVAVKRPLINQLRAQNRTQEITRLFCSRTQLALLTYLVGAVAILLLGSPLLNLIHARTTLVPRPELIVLLIICLLETHHVCYSLLITTENQNPFLVPSLASGLAIVILSVVLTPFIGLWGLVVTFGAVQLCFNNWWPIRRGIRGLNLSTREYWTQFFGLG
jgi:O-antigen/teichoic acid export membrane protein